MQFGILLVLVALIGWFRVGAATEVHPTASDLSASQVRLVDHAERYFRAVWKQQPSNHVVLSAALDRLDQALHPVPVAKSIKSKQGEIAAPQPVYEVVTIVSPTSTERWRTTLDTHRPTVPFELKKSEDTARVLESVQVERATLILEQLRAALKSERIDQSRFEVLLDRLHKELGA